MRSNPALSTSDLLALAEKQGIPLTAGYVYNIRAAQRAAADPASGSAAPEGGAEKARAGKLDAQLRTLIIRIGLDRAEQIFGELKASLSRIV